MAHTWIDATSPVKELRSIRDGRLVYLTMSDEYSVDNRTFDGATDSIFRAVDKPDFSNEALQYYNSSVDYVTTRDGKLVIATRPQKSIWMEWDYSSRRPIARTKNYTSGMVQSWNKFCFTGGILEIAVQIPAASGMWPAAWLVGNLARATFDKSTMFMWPWSYSKCGAIDALSEKQEVNACDPDPGYGMHPFQGRGAPEIDIFEMMPPVTVSSIDASGSLTSTITTTSGFLSSSLHVAPGVPIDANRPKNGKELNKSYVWYENLQIGENVRFNSGFWGSECGPEYDTSSSKIHKYMEDAISVNCDLPDLFYETSHVYRIEWQPPDPSDPSMPGYVYWYLDNELILGIDGGSLDILTGAHIPAEPMYMIINTAMSHRWAMGEPCAAEHCAACWHCYDCTNPDCQCALPDGLRNCANLPSEIKVDYIRLYQDPKDPLHTIGCSPPAFPTAEFISNHPSRYQDWQPLSTRVIVAYWMGMSAAVFLCASLTLYALFLIYRVVITRRHRSEKDLQQSPTADTPFRYQSIDNPFEIEKD